MELFFVVLLVMLVLIAIMSIGVILGRKPITGSCGGMSALGMEVSCDICGGDKSKCEKEKAKRESPESDDQSRFYDATKKNN